jgi:hypothetical protein
MGHRRDRVVSDVAVKVVLAPGEYALQARAEVSSPAPERTYRLDATFGNDLVGVEGATWSVVKQLFRERGFATPADQRRLALAPRLVHYPTPTRLHEGCSGRDSGEALRV